MTTEFRTPCTLEAFAAARRLDPARLRELGIHDADTGLQLPCLDEHGRPTGSVRVRPYLETAHPTKWIGAPMLYGRQAVCRARELGELVLVEGESCQLTLGEHEIPALGIPGASMTRLLDLHDVRGIDRRIFVVREPDKGGAQFVDGVAKRLHELVWRGTLLVVDLAEAYGVKDVSDLHVADPKFFDERWRAATAAGKRYAVATASAAPALNLRDLREVRFERVRWFEEQMIPRAELTLVNGDGGIGKTTAMLDLIARASAGRPMPSGLRHDRSLRCLIVAEEDRHGLLRARLDIAGADHDNIRLVESVGDEREYLTFPRHTEALSDTILGGGYDFVLIDALLSHLDDDINASRPQEMRKALRPVVEVAHETGVTICAIRHIGKGAGPASTRGFGSAEARNLCRSELTVAEHPDKDGNPGVVVVAPSKANLSAKQISMMATMAFRLTSTDVDDDDGMPTSMARVEWLEAPPAISADELLERPDGAERSRIFATVDWLRGMFSDGWRRAADVCAEGEATGYSRSTIYRARATAGVISELRGFPAQSYWNLKEAQVSHDFQHGNPETPETPGDEIIEEARF